MDGKIEKSELKGLIGKMLLPRWDQLDTNHDGVLDKDEIAAASKLLGGRRQEAAAPAASPAPTAGGR
jgi:hypothetical protein